MINIQAQSGSEVERATLLTGITSELGQWSLDVAAYPIDDVPHLIATLDRRGARAITAIEIALRCDASERRRAHTQSRRFVLRASGTRDRGAQPIVCAMPLIEVRQGQPLTYEVTVLGNSSQLARLSGAFYIAQGQLVPC